LLLEQGWQLNRKRTQRLWREEGLRLPRRRRKRQRLGDSTVAAQRLRAEAPNHVWALDFQFDQTADGRILKLLHVVDEFTCEAQRSDPRPGAPSGIHGVVGAGRDEVAQPPAFDLIVVYGFQVVGEAVGQLIVSGRRDELAALVAFDDAHP
jgi:hypothetical protein